MKLAIQIICYTMAVTMFLGVIGLISDGGLDGITFIMFLLIEAQSILTLTYISNKK